MKKVITILGFLLLSVGFVFAQSEEELFGSDDDLFGTEEDLFSDDGIEEITDTTAKDNLSKGILFEAGSVKVGGSFRTGIDTKTKLYNPDEDDFGTNVKDTTLIPTLNAFLSVDARPTEVLRLYTKFGINYPFVSKGQLKLNLNNTKDLVKIVPPKNPTEKPTPILNVEALLKQVSNSEITIKDWFTLKELFTDFSIKDTAFFRFGLHTVSWGTGYFFSPVSDIINSSMIDPENPTDQVDGSLNLRTQIVFPNTQNCLWLYVVPSTKFNKGTTAESYARDTALAGKFDLVVGDWELGFGGLWKYESAPKAMLTASGNIKKLSLFGELVYQYGSTTEWMANTDWDDKTNIFQATVGGFYTWKNPGIAVGLQYYYDGNDKDLANRLFTNGHNIAFVANFSKLGNAKDLSIALFGITNFDRAGYTEEEQKQIDVIEKQFDQKAPNFPCFMLNAMLNYSPVNNINLSIGPEMTFSDFEKEPTVSLKIGAKLGGGKF